MNNVIYKFLLTADTFKPEAHMRQPEFKYSACGPFTKKKKKRIQKFKVTRDSKACFQYDMLYGGFNDLPRTTKKRHY